MAADYHTIAHSLMELECYRRYTVHTLLRNSELYFGQPPALEYLAEHGDCTQNEIAKAMNVSPASMAVSIRRMQKSGLVDKASDSNDMRCNKVSLTEKGKKQVELIHHRFNEMNEKMFAGFSDEELELLNSYIDRMNNNLSQGAPEKRKIFEIMKNNFKKTSEGDNE